MKQDIATYVVDSFIDFAGKEHKFVACALSQTPDDSEADLMVGWIREYDVLDTNAELCHDVYRMVTVGFAICNPSDEFDLEAGKRIAYGKAAGREDLPRLYTPNKGVITKELVETFLNQQVKFFKENPETLIAGYDKARKEYEAIERAKNEIDNLSEDEKTAFNLAVKGVDLSKYVNLAKVYVKKILKHD